MFIPTSKNKLSNSTVKKIKQQYEIDLGSVLGKEEKMESIKTTERETYILRNGTAVFLESEKAYFPTVKMVHLLPDIVKRAVVDEGAIKHLVNGADVMAPGLLHKTSEYLNVQEGDVVAVYGYEKKHALGVGVATMSSERVEEERNGVAIKMFSKLGDRAYEYPKV